MTDFEYDDPEEYDPDYWCDDEPERPAKEEPDCGECTDSGFITRGQHSAPCVYCTGTVETDRALALISVIQRQRTVVLVAAGLLPAGSDEPPF